MNTATCHSSTKLSTESSGRRTFAPSNAVSEVGTISCGLPGVLNAVASSTTERKFD